MLRRTIKPSLAILIFALGVTLLGQGIWLQGKALVAQWLIRQAWAETVQDGSVHKAWPWADHNPVARLVVPEHDRDLLVLEGDSGAVLAFGPGHNPQSGLPGNGQTVVISGHRDTHFKFLKALRPGDGIRLDTTHYTQRYRVTEARVLDSRVSQLGLGDGSAILLLVTCYPFEALTVGGPLRYVVSAKPYGEPTPLGR